MSEELKFLEYISTRLGSAGIPYMLTGSMAMMLASVPELDFVYLEKWAAQLGVLSKLDELRP